MPDKPANEVYIYCMLLSQAYCRLTGEAKSEYDDGPLAWRRKVLRKKRVYTKINVSMGYSKAEYVRGIFDFILPRIAPNDYLAQKSNNMLGRAVDKYTYCN